MSLLQNALDKISAPLQTLQDQASQIVCKPGYRVVGYGKGVAKCEPIEQPQLINNTPEPTPEMPTPGTDGRPAPKHSMLPWLAVGALALFFIARK